MFITGQLYNITRDYFRQVNDHIKISINTNENVKVILILNAECIINNKNELNLIETYLQKGILPTITAEYVEQYENYFVNINKKITYNINKIKVINN